MRSLEIQDYETAFGAAPVLILAPHPDDESLGCGGLIAEASARGHPPIVAILTDGAMSHPASRTHPPERLLQLREEETKEATRLLGLPPNRLVFLRYRDTAAPSEGAALDQAAARLSAIITSHACRTVLVSWQHDPHCDHEAAARIAAVACAATGTRLLAFPVWGWTLPPAQPIDQRPITGFRLDVNRHLTRKRAAILAHRSQYAGIIQDDPSGFQLDPAFIDRFLGTTETFIDMDPNP